MELSKKKTSGNLLEKKNVGKNIKKNSQKTLRKHHENFIDAFRQAGKKRVPLPYLSQFSQFFIEFFYNAKKFLQRWYSFSYLDLQLKR